MARKAKTQPNIEAIVPARRGHKAKVAALSFASPPAAGVGSPAPDGTGADVSKAGLTKALGGKG